MVARSVPQVLAALEARGLKKSELWWQEKIDETNTEVSSIWLVFGSLILPLFPQMAMVPVIGHDEGIGPAAHPPLGTGGNHGSTSTATVETIKPRPPV